MNTEQKAQAYDKALEIARQYYEKDSMNAFLDTIFPSLAESEDERIRRKMLEHFRSKTKETWCNMPVKDIIAYLEKQKECLADNSKTLASEDERIRKFLVDFFASYKIGDVATKLNGVRIDDILAYLEKQKEQKPAKWSEEDENVYKTIMDDFNGITPMSKAYKLKAAKWLKSFRPQYHGDVTMTEAYKMGLEAGKASHWKPRE